MSMSLYNQKRQALAGCYDRVMAVADGLGDRQVRSALEQVKSELFGDAFQLVVVGEFSRGKSTFVNALLGERVLPANIEPTTAMINKIVFGGEKSFTLHFRNGSAPQTLTPDEFKELVARNQRDYAAIAYAEIRYPLGVCKDGVSIIDTPGTNDIDQAREEITHKFIPEADAAILVLSAQQICSRSELDFLKEHILKNDITKIFCVVNFKDNLESEEDGRRIVQKAREELRKAIANPRVYLVSSKGALNWRRRERGEQFKGKVPADFAQTGFEDFERDLGRYLIDERMGTKLEKYVLRLCHHCKTLTDQGIAVREQNIGASTAELMRRIEALRPQVEKIKRGCARIVAHAKTEFGFAADELALDYSGRLRRNSRELLMAINGYSGELEANALARYVESVMAPLQSKAESDMRRQLNERFRATFDKVCADIGALLQEAVQERSLMVVDGQQTSQGAALVPVSIELERISTEDSDMVGAGLVFGGLVLAMSMPFIAIPAALFGGNFFLRKFREYKRADFLSKATTAIRERYEGNIAAQSEGFKSEVKRQADGLLSSIESMVAAKLDAVEGQMQRLLTERQASAQQDEATRQRLKGYRDELSKAQAAARALGAGK